MVTPSCQKYIVPGVYIGLPAEVVHHSTALYHFFYINWLQGATASEF